MNRRNSRQVLDCGDEVGEVTALAGATLKLPMSTADLASPTESGDSVAAVQDASRADSRRTRFRGATQRFHIGYSKKVSLFAGHCVNGP